MPSLLLFLPAPLAHSPGPTSCLPIWKAVTGLHTLLTFHSTQAVLPTALVYLAHRLTVPIVFPNFFQKVFEGRDWACSPLGKHATDIPDIWGTLHPQQRHSVGDFSSSAAGLRWEHFYLWGTWALWGSLQ